MQRHPWLQENFVHSAYAGHWQFYANGPKVPDSIHEAAKKGKAQLRKLPRQQSRRKR